MITNPMPRLRYQESAQNVSNHREMIQSSIFQKACDYAVMEYAARLVSATDTHDQAAVHAMGMKIAGAHEFLLVMRMLSEKPTLPPAQEKTPNLDHKA